MDLALIIQLISGAVGGNIAGSLMKNLQVWALRSIQLLVFWVVV